MHCTLATVEVEVGYGSIIVASSVTCLFHISGTLQLEKQRDSEAQASTVFVSTVVVWKRGSEGPLLGLTSGTCAKGPRAISARVLANTRPHYGSSRLKGPLGVTNSDTSRKGFGVSGLVCPLNF